MFKIIAQWIVNAISLYLVSVMVSGFYLDSFQSALKAAFLLSIVNLFVKPIIILFTLPLTIITFGLFTLVVNAFMLYIVSAMLSGFEINSFGNAILSSILLSVIYTILNFMIKK